MGKAHSNKGRFFSFPNARVMDNFINLFDDLFTPYSGEVVKYERNYNDYGTEMDLCRGFKVITQTKERQILRVNLTKENLDEILKSGCFTKEIFQRGRNIYAWKES